MTVDLTPIIEATIGLIGVILTAFVVPAIKQKIDKNKLEKLKYWATVAVQAVEEADRNGTLPKSEKFDKAMEIIQAQGFKIDTESLKSVIDAEVWSLINQFKEEKDDVYVA